MRLPNVGSCVGPLWVLCLLLNTWCKEEEEEGVSLAVSGRLDLIGKGFGGCAAPNYHHFLCLTKPASHGLLLSALMIVLPATLWPREHMEWAVSLMTAWERAYWGSGPFGAIRMF
eukprot:1161993-Pelagomonas_calceolata.AAC.10